MRKILYALKTIFVWLFVLLAVSMMLFTIISSTVFNRNDRNLFGYKMYIVNSDSMASTDFNAGDLILVKSVNPSSLQEGDIVTFISQNTHSFGETITHKIRSLTFDAQGNPGFITYGTTTNTDDETIVTYPQIVGKYQGHIPYLGRFFGFLKTTPGYFLCIFLPFLLVITNEAVRFFKLLRNYKQEQTSELQEEKNKLLEELQALKKEMDVHRAILTGSRFSDKDPNNKPSDPNYFDREFYNNNSFNFEDDDDFEWRR